MGKNGIAINFNDEETIICFSGVQIHISEYKKLQKENELLRKDIEGWKKYCEEIEAERIEMSNKNCELEFEVEKLQKENEELKNNGPIDENEFGFVVDCDYNRLKRLIDTANKSEEFILYNNEKWIKEKYSVPTEKIKDKIEELENANWYCKSVKNQTIRALKELLKEEE